MSIRTPHPEKYGIKIRLVDDSVKPSQKEKDKDKEKKKDHRGHLISEVESTGTKMVAKILGVPVEEEKEYDLIYDGKKIDVITNSMDDNSAYGPMQNGIMTPDKYNKNQDCDIYLFARYNPVNDKFYVLGWISRDDFYKRSHFNAVGESIGCQTAKFDGHRISFRQLKKFDELVQ